MSLCLSGVLWRWHSLWQAWIPYRNCPFQDEPVFCQLSPCLVACTENCSRSSATLSRNCLPHTPVAQSLQHCQHIDGASLCTAAHNDVTIFKSLLFKKALL